MFYILRIKRSKFAWRNSWIQLQKDIILTVKYGVGGVIVWECPMVLGVKRWRRTNLIP